MGIGQVIYFEPPRVTLSSEAPPPAKSSDLLGFVSGEVAKSTTVDVGLQYTPTTGQSEKIYVGAHYAPEPGSTFNAAYRYTRGSTDPNDPAGPTGIQQVDFSTQWPILRNIQALARWNYSLVDHKLIEGLAGFEYNAGCWQLRAVAHRFITATQTYSTSFQIQLELTGLSRIGINPLETLRQNITGYKRSDEINHEARHTPAFRHDLPLRSRTGRIRPGETRHQALPHAFAGHRGRSHRRGRERRGDHAERAQ